MLLSSDTAGLKFLANAFLLLHPRDLKACRLVCREWNKFIKDEVWGSSKGRKELTKKLVDRWLSFDAMPVELRQVPKHGETYNGEERHDFTHHEKNIFCNNRNIFIGQSNGVVTVYCINSGAVVDHLLPGDRVLDGRVALSGKEGIVASAVMLDPQRCVGTIWSSKGEMSVLGNYLLVPNCLNNGHSDCEFSIWRFAIASDSKVVALMHCDEHISVSLVIARKTGENIWESNTLYSDDDDEGPMGH